MTRQVGREDERVALPRLVVEAWARSQLGAARAVRWWCPTCQAEKGRADVRPVIDRREARHFCRRCGTVLNREVILI